MTNAIDSQGVIWIVDDDRSIRWVLEKALQKEQLSCRTFESAEDAIKALEAGRPAVLVSDIRMHAVSGLELLKVVKERYSEVPVIIMTAYSDLDSAVSAFEAGAFEYLPKPFDVPAAVSLIRRAFEESGVRKEKKNLELVGKNLTIIGQSGAMQEVFRAIGRLSQTHATVLLTGESGTGKEVVARALHEHSPRRNAPFVAINMAAIPHDLLESELFGHEKGAFTGASAQRSGRFEQAKGGTLFLDEIGDMPMELQTRLLRVLSDGNFYRVGGRELIQTDVRIIAATNQNLEARVREGQFREDLFHRLNVIRLRLPPLRERGNDVVALAEHFLSVAAKDLQVEQKVLTEEAKSHLVAFDFPGNVRQLENLCKWLTVMAPLKTIRLLDLPEEFQSETQTMAVPMTSETDSASGDWQSFLRHETRLAFQNGTSQWMKRCTEALEKTLYEEALAFTHGKRIQAAQILGVGRNTLTRKLKELGFPDA